MEGRAMTISEFWRARQSPGCKVNWEELKWASFRELYRFRKNPSCRLFFFLGFGIIKVN